ncbi:MAG: porin family protein [Ekhidna sp.]|uniref:porin family protein n=1 Tax=Ekhidna sp. TaxID=2608089 RepID=UPI0032EB2F9F
MKKTLLTLSLIFFSVVAFSQASVSLGIKAGANFANTNISGSESITSFHGGAYGLIKLANIGIQPEMLFSKQGASFSTADVDLSYLNVPVMVKFYLPMGLNLQAGPQFGILTKAESGSVDVKDAYKSSDISAALGAGWDAPFGLQFTARYVLGLSDINDSGAGDEVKNRTFQLSIGYSLFKLGK